MARDFTLKKYNELLEAINDADYETKTVRDYLQSPDGKCIVLRHDVDRKPELALSMSELESKQNIVSTYYFRYKPYTFKPHIIKEIAKNDHEVGHHYEVIDKAKGDEEKAIDIFKDELEKFRQIAKIDTVCMHGNPLSKWTNRDLWKKYDFNNYDIIGEPYLSMDYSKILYLSDTGRTWSNSKKIRVKDTLENKESNKTLFHGIDPKSTDDVIEMILSQKFNQMCILVHPNRWDDNLISWIIELTTQNIKNIGKAAIIKYRKRTN